jgi:hypothetical protein
MKQVMQLDAGGYFIGITDADESPLEAGVYLIPAGAVEADLPDVPEGHLAKWDGAWLFEAIPEPVVPEPSPAYATAAKASAAMVAWIDRLTGAVTDLYPAAIQGGWVEEEAMAEAYLAGFEDAAQRATLQADADAKGRSMADHAARILENAHAFRTIAKQARTLWLATDAALAAATDPDQYAVILASAAAQGATLAATYGLAVPPP